MGYGTVCCAPTWTVGYGRFKDCPLRNGLLAGISRVVVSTPFEEREYRDSSEMIHFPPATWHIPRPSAMMDVCCEKGPEMRNLVPICGRIEETVGNPD